MRYLLVGVLAALIAVYGVAAFLTREHWAGNVRQDRTVVTFSARTPDGSPPAGEALGEAGRLWRRGWRRSAFRGARWPSTTMA